MSRINKPELVSAVSTAVDLPRTKVDRVLDALIAEIERATEAGATVSIAKFGVFDLRPSAARVGRNPRTGEAVEIPASAKLRFRPAKRAR